MEEKSLYITVTDGLGEKTVIPRAGLEYYKKQMAEFTEFAKKNGSTPEELKAYQIVSIEE